MNQQDRYRLERPASRHPDEPGLLRDRLIELAGTPDDSALISTDLLFIARLAVDRIDAVEHAAVTPRPGGPDGVGVCEFTVEPILCTPLSIPVFAGSGDTVAALNLYTHRYGSLEDLAAAVLGVYDPDLEPGGPADDPLDAGSRELLAGLGGALERRATIQQAVGVLMAGTDRTAAQAYQALRSQAAAAGESLTAAATSIIAAGTGPGQTG